MSTDAMEGRTKPIIGPRGMVMQMALALALALGISAIFGRQALSDLLLQGTPWQTQLAWGIAIGLLFACPAVVLIKRASRFDAFYRQMIELVSRADLSGFNPLWFSLCAGVGEEMLFRGALQPLLGLWLTSVIFTALHYQTGSFRTMNRMKAVYAFLVFFASLILGTVFSQIGLVAAIVTHGVIDIVALTTLRTGRSHSAGHERPVSDRPGPFRR
jgi:hypothetical protein